MQVRAIFSASIQMTIWWIAIAMFVLVIIGTVTNVVYGLIVVRGHTKEEFGRIWWQSLCRSKEVKCA